jgi:hypothetical protein
MQVNNVSLGAMFGWVLDSFKLLFKSPFAMIVSSIVSLVVLFLIFLPLVAASIIAPDNMKLFIGAYALNVFIGLILFPPLISGWFRFCRTVDNGGRANGFFVLNAYRDFSVWGRGLGFSLIGFFVYFGVMALFLWVYFDPLVQLMQYSAAQEKASVIGQLAPFPSLPLSFYFAYLALIPFLFGLSYIYMLAFAEISLRPTGVFEALKLAIFACFKNFFKLAFFTVAAGIVLYLVFLILIVVLVFFIALLSMMHVALGMVIGGFLYLVIVLLMYPLMFSGYYFVWKSMLGPQQNPMRPYAAS